MGWWKMAEEEKGGKVFIPRIFKHDVTMIVIVMLALAISFYALTQINSEVGRIKNYYESFISDYCICSRHNSPLGNYTPNYTTTGTIPEGWG
jgi:hypothetical protein